MITYLSFIPVGCLMDGDSRVHGGQLICVGLHTDARVVAQ